MRYVLLVAALVAATLSGCLAGGNSDLQTVNSQLIDEARETLGEDATLYAIMGVELSKTIPAEDTDGCGEIPRSDNPGDGRAPVWLYAYASPSRGEGLMIVTDDHGRERCQMKESIRYIASEPLGAWSIDSVEAAKTIADNVDDYKDLVQGADVHMALAQASTGPVWEFEIWNMVSEEFAAWLVHAQTGEFLGPSSPITRPIEHEAPKIFPDPESGSAEGSVILIGTPGVGALVTDPAIFTIQDAGHQYLEITVESDELLAADGESYRVSVTDPDGEKLDFDATNGEPIHLIPSQGEWTVQVHPRFTGEAAFTVDYHAYSQPQVAVGESSS
jgi:hypothetical protein